jgi:hypothetical protein
MSFRMLGKVLMLMFGLFTVRRPKGNRIINGRLYKKATFIEINLFIINPVDDDGNKWMITDHDSAWVSSLT